MTLLLVFTLSACKTNDISFEKALNLSLSRPLPSGTNHNKPYFKYYLPPDAGVKTSTELASLYTIDNHEIMMNLKVSKVVASQYENHEPEKLKLLNEDEKLYYFDNSKYLDQKDQEREINLRVYELKNQQFAVILENEFVEMLTLVNATNYEFILEHMVAILRSVEVEEEKVFVDFSNKEIIEDKTIHEDFFEHVVPEDGSLIDMYNQLHPDDKIKD